MPEIYYELTIILGMSRNTRSFDPLKDKVEDFLGKRNLVVYTLVNDITDIHCIQDLLL
jgi:hypothetical protein